MLYSGDISLHILEDLEENYKLLEKWCSQEEIYYHFEQKILCYDEIVNKYKLRCDINSKIPVYMICYKNKKIGIIQYKKLDNYYKNLYEIKEDNAYDIDLFIGELNLHSKGLGNKAIDLISDYLFNKKQAKLLTLCPLKENIKAINCYKKSGYKIKKEFKNYNTIGELKEYLLMERKYERNNT